MSSNSAMQRTSGSSADDIYVCGFANKTSLKKANTKKVREALVDNEDDNEALFPNPFSVDVWIPNSEHRTDQATKEATWIASELPFTFDRLLRMSLASEDQTTCDWPQKFQETIERVAATSDRLLAHTFKYNPVGYRPMAGTAETEATQKTIEADPTTKEEFCKKAVDLLAESQLPGVTQVDYKHLVGRWF